MARAATIGRAGTPLLVLLLILIANSQFICAQTRLYVSNGDLGNVVVVDPTGLSILAAIPLVDSPGIIVHPFKAAVSPDGSQLYLCDLLGISVVNTATNSFQMRIPLERALLSTCGVAFSPDGRRAYATDGIGIAVIDVQSGAVLTHIAFGRGGNSIAISADGKLAYASGVVGDLYSLDLTTNTAHPVSLSNEAISSTVCNLGGISIAPDGAHAFVAWDACGDGGALIIDTGSNQITGILRDPSDPFFPPGRLIAITPDGRFVYLASSGFFSTLAAVITVFDLSSDNSIVGRIVFPSLEDFAMSPDGKRLYVADGSQGFEIIDTGSNTVIGTVATGGEASAVAITPNVAAPCMAPPSIDSITPTQGGNTGTVSFSIGGSGLLNGDQFALTSSGTSSIVASNVSVAGSCLIATGVFDLTGAVPGVYDLLLVSPAGRSTILSNSFTIEEGGAPQVSAEALGWKSLRAGRAQTYYVLFTNRGNVDARSVPFVVNFNKFLSMEPGSVVIPPPLQPGQPSIDWSQVPISIDPAGFSAAPLLVPLVPAGSYAVVPLSLTAPFSTTPHQPFQACPLVGDSQQLGSIQNWAPGYEAAIKQMLSDVFPNSNIPPDCLKALMDYFSSIWSGEQALAQASLRNGKPFTVNSLLQNLLDLLQLMAECLGKPLPPLADQVVEVLRVVADHLDTDTLPPWLLSPQICLQGQVIISGDPNDISGPSGVGSQRYISDSIPQAYVISFSNEDTATAPAQDVVISDELDLTNDDLTTFNIGPISLGSQLVSPPPGLTNYTTTVDLRPANNLLVKINVRLDMTKGVLTWSFTSLDPSTNLPPTDPASGFLPPGGVGTVFFSVLPRKHLATNTQIRNQATIVFDVNAPMSTPTWSNTIDNTPPVSRVATLLAIESSPSFTVQWAGTDFGAGVQDFTIYVSDNGGPFAVWQQNTTATSATFVGQVGHTYGFYSIARDLVDNIEAAKTVADATTQVATDTTPPVTIASVSPGPNTNGWNNSNITVNLNSTDSEPGGTGVKQITYSATGAQAIASTVVNGASDSFTISTEGITTITFFGTDNANNVEAPKTITIRLDKTAPTIMGSRTPPPNINGWNNISVTVSFQCSDALSGLAGGSPPAPTTLSTEGAGQSVTGICSDLAGNYATSTVSSINIDKTPPTLACSVSPDVLWPPNNKLVPVKLSVIVTDALSGAAGFTLLSVTSNEPDRVQGSIQGFVTETASTSGQLRAQRLGSGTGRVYTFAYSGADRAGNTASCGTTVAVPHDQGH
jgi:hypothetical protein